jgi:hypothetical protein
VHSKFLAAKHGKKSNPASSLKEIAKNNQLLIKKSKIRTMH